MYNVFEASALNKITIVCCCVFPKNNLVLAKIATIIAIGGLARFVM